MYLLKQIKFSKKGLSGAFRIAADFKASLEIYPLPPKQMYCMPLKMANQYSSISVKSGVTKNVEILIKSRGVKPIIHVVSTGHRNK